MLYATIVTTIISANMGKSKIWTNRVWILVITPTWHSLKSVSTHNLYTNVHTLAWSQAHFQDKNLKYHLTQKSECYFWQFKKFKICTIQIKTEQLAGIYYDSPGSSYTLCGGGWQSLPLTWNPPLNRNYRIWAQHWWAKHYRKLDVSILVRHNQICKTFIKSHRALN